MYYLLFASVLSIVASQIHYENCEKLSDDLSLRWTLDTAVNGIYYNLEATDVPSGNWIGFGISKQQSRRAAMIGSDATVAYSDGTKVQDYHLVSKKPCDLKGSGVCPDDVFGGTRDLINAKGTFVDGILSVSYFKSLNSGDTHDLPLNVSKSIYVISATGKMSRGRYNIPLPQGRTRRSTSNVQRKTNALRKGYIFTVDLGCEVQLYWKRLDTDSGVCIFPGHWPNSQVISMAMTRKTPGWVAVGFSPNGNMVGSDAVLGWVDGSGSKVNPFSLTGQTPEEVVGNPGLSISNRTATEINGITTVYFVRKLDTGDNPIYPQRVILIGAYSDADRIVQHSCSSARAVQVNLLTGESQFLEGDNSMHKTAHGILMMLGFGYFIIWGAGLARYSKSLGAPETWFKGLGVVLITAGAIVAFDMNAGRHFQTQWHSQFGLAILILVWIQTLLGVVRPPATAEGEDKTAWRQAFEYVHPNLGRLVIIAAVVNIFNGIATSEWHFWVFIFYGCCLGVMAIVAGVMEYLLQTRVDGEKRI